MPKPIPKPKGQTPQKESAPDRDNRKPEAERLLHRINANAQAGLIARGGVLVQRPLLNGLVERGDGLAEHLLGGRLVAFFNGLAQGAQLGAQGGSVGAVPHGAAFSLARTFQRRKMICHSWFVTFVSAEDIRVGPNSLL